MLRKKFRFLLLIIFLFHLSCNPALLYVVQISVALPKKMTLHKYLYNFGHFQQNPDGIYIGMNHWCLYSLHLSRMSEWIC